MADAVDEKNPFENAFSRQVDRLLETEKQALRELEPRDGPDLEDRQSAASPMLSASRSATSSSRATTRFPSPRRTPGGGSGPASSIITSG